MQYIYEFDLTVKEYSQRGKNNQFPEFNTCLMCNAQKSLDKHSFYPRNVF